jgi:DICT domain-containing protein
VSAVRALASAEPPGDIRGQQRHFSSELPALWAELEDALVSELSSRELSFLASVAGELSKEEED